jgi:hypothetical protein
MTRKTRFIVLCLLGVIASLIMMNVYFAIEKGKEMGSLDTLIVP